MIRIPLAPDGASHFEQLTDLDGTYYSFEFYWNRHSETWTCKLANQDGSPIVQDLRMVCDIPLLVSVTQFGRPEGELYLLRGDGSNEPPKRDELGAIAQLYYFSKADL